MKTLHVSHVSQTINGTIDLASSKSESNRALIINALSGGSNDLQNLANARDTQTMQRLLKSQEDVLDVLDAGTTMRFLTAYCAVQNKKVVLTGSQRMQERPIKLLVDALRTLGAEISYEGNEGYPPIRLHGFDQNTSVSELSIRGDVSSQYISALLMVAPSLPNGLRLKLIGKVGSKPYIQMTLNLMKHFGAEASWEDNIITVPAQKYKEQGYTIEGDWSGASYWYSMVALAKEGSVQLNGLRNNSNQGDSVLAEMMPILGVKTTFNDNGVLLEKCPHESSFEWDFTHCPDIAQTISVIAAAKGVNAKLTGLESLRIKETDRIDAIRNELAKYGVEVEIFGDEAISISSPVLDVSKEPSIATYKDHRMAMAFAPLGMIGKLVIENPSVVDKSYPDYWRDLDAVGFTLTEETLA